MNKNTHKTISVLATMETELYLNINVPIDTDKADIWDFICDANIDGEDMIAFPGYTHGSWRWQEPHYYADFDPDAKNVSKEIKKYE